MLYSTTAAFQMNGIILMSQRLSETPTFIRSKFSFSAPLIPFEALQCAETVFKGRSLTVCDLEQSLGDDAASDVEGLATVVPHV